MKKEANIDSLLLGETRSRFCSLKQQLLLFFILNQGKAQQRGFISASLLRNTAILAGVGREVMSVLVLAAFWAQPERPSSQCDGGLISRRPPWRTHSVPSATIPQSAQPKRQLSPLDEECVCWRGCYRLRMYAVSQTPSYMHEFDRK